MSISRTTTAGVEPDPWLTPAQVAELLGLTANTIRLWISRGDLPAVRLGRRKLGVRRSDVMRLVRVTDQPDAAAHVEVGEGGRPPTPGERLIDTSGEISG